MTNAQYVPEDVIAKVHQTAPWVEKNLQLKHVHEIRHYLLTNKELEAFWLLAPYDQVDQR